MTFKSAASQAPPAQRVNTLVAYYSACREEPTTAELDAAGIPEFKQITIFLVRGKLAAGESNTRVTRVLQSIEELRGHLRTYEFLAGDVAKIHQGGEITPASYTIVAETLDSLVMTLAVANDPGGPATYQVTMQGDDVLAFSDPTHQHADMTLAREGTDDPMNAPQPSPIPAGLPVPAALVGRWKSADEAEVEFRANQEYIVNIGGPMRGHFWVTQANGNNITVRTRTLALPPQFTQTIEIVLDGDSLSWHNVGVDQRLQMTRQ